MAGRSRVIDPLTRDYVVDGKGGRKTTRTVQTSLYHAFQGRRGRWPGDDNHGSDIWRLVRERLTADSPARAENAMRVAAQPFLDEGLLRSFEARAEREPITGRLLIETAAVDAQTGPIDISDIVPFE